MKVIVKSPVWDDLRQIGASIAKDNPRVANRFFLAAKRAFRLLGQFPEIGRLRSFSQPGIRSWVIRGFDRYLIFYLPTIEEIQVLAVLHGARQFEALIEARL